MEFFQNVFMQLLPDAQFFPMGQPLVGGLGGTAHTFGVAPPAAAGSQHEPDRFEDNFVGTRRSTTS
ncbi:hypothetical protein Spb1_21810 [Planctopirus ephydatiae]|uniref:Uncharacterized protein n=1 Tax=Planctopirus ephydatiae TaxID=2528019 RepID=A0A518GNP7_9PLAN|nr:hypothetical protein Spb1_21810 [Planctopirus ephydatiae]